MLKAYKYRLYPTPSQEERINQHIGACRLIYNLALETKEYAYRTHRVNISCFDLMKQTTQLRKECGWLKKVCSESLSRSIANLDIAYKNFFTGKSDYPKYKSKSRGRQSYTVRDVKIKDGKVIFPKFQEGVRFSESQIIKGELRKSIVSRTPTGKYYISILVETGIPVPDKKPITSKDSIGIDLGLTHFAITSNGQKFDNPKYLKNSIERMKALQRRLRNKKRGSKNRKKALRRIAVIYERIANQRKDFLHKLSTNLINSHDTVCLETLNIEGMLRNHKLAGAISDAGWGEFVRQLKYKSDLYGKNILQIGRFEASTKVCSVCETVNDTLTLKDREWICATCGTLHDRDINAAVVIKNICLKNPREFIPVASVESRTIVRAKKQKIKVSI